MTKGPFANEIRVEALRPQLRVEDLLDTLQPLTLPFLLESGLDPAGTGRWHIAGAEPIGMFQVCGGSWRATLSGSRAEGDGEPWKALDDWWRSWSGDAVRDDAALARWGLPVGGGAFGFLGYEFGERIENFPSRDLPEAEVEIPDVHLNLYDELLIVERASGRAFYLHRGRAGFDERRFWERETDRGVPSRFAVPPTVPMRAELREVAVSLTRARYLCAVEEIREAIRGGDVYEVNLTRRHEFAGAPSPWDLYRRLRRAQPVPYAALLPWEPVAVVSASPERFLRRAGEFVETRPIKGTRARGATPEEDLRRAGELLASAKERAELAMIIDLERNDLGRVCVPGTVVVAEEAAVESYATVLHTVATVQGRVPASLSPVALLRATFPGGSITGAPKIAAMKMIRRFEPVPRKVYTGSIGWIAPNGDVDLSIAIRTAFMARQRTYVSLGGAITWDSSPEEEFAELEAKGRAILAALRGAV